MGSDTEGGLDPVPDRPLRTGYTTGACATAAALAATRALRDQKPVPQVEITLPRGEKATFEMSRCEVSPGRVYCATIKDGGDDPDCTHQAEIGAEVQWDPRPGVHLEGGTGVGRVTKPGLGLEVEGPAINPVPRKMITEHVAKATNGRGVRVTIIVPRGAELAKRTLNDRLGILGGISILGTTGIVYPYSTAAFKASITQGIDVARAGGCDHIVITTGGKSETFAMKLLPHLEEEAFIQMGDFVEFTLTEAAARGARKVTTCGMIGKLSKQAKGTGQTHARKSEVDTRFMADLARQCGAPPGVAEEIEKANTARHVMEIVQQHGVPGFFDLLCRRVCEANRTRLGPKIATECILTDFEGNVLGRGELP
ncbi:MAG: cobalt-precorrin-5B (C(1))-methyltransferase [Euryarchaeota archaeon]|nr:cobalt-precorrin-5B (C(1))-methyltransferase [Euryarchaeota archaeon]